MTEIRFENPPLLCVVISIQVEPINKLARFLPALLKSLQAIGLTEFDEVDMSSVRFDLNPDSEPRVSWETADQWDFKDREKTTLLRIDPNAGVFRLHFSKYRHFANMRDKITSIAFALTDTIPNLVTREISLRYVNHIPTQPGENLLNWIHPSVLGLPAQPDLELERIGSNSESLFESGPDSRLIIRCVTASGGFIIPPDLMPLDLDFRFAPVSDTPFIRMENTHISRKGIALTTDDLISTLDQLRSAISALFIALTTETAQKSWQ